MSVVDRMIPLQNLVAGLKEIALETEQIQLQQTQLDLRQSWKILALETVLNWSVEDLLNNQLLTTQVTEIPPRFVSGMHYARSFFWPLLEEMRESLSQAVRNRPPMIPVQYLAIVSRRSSPKYKRLLNIKMGLNLKPSQGMRRGHVVLISNGAHDVADRDNFLAYVEGRSSDACKLCLPNNLYGKIAFCSRPFFAFCLDDLTGFLYTIDCLQQLARTGESNPLLAQILPADKEQPSQIVEAATRSLNKVAESYGLNDAQTRGLIDVAGSMLDVQQRHFLKIIQGPPGTGKTATIVAILSLLGNLGFRILVTAPTNKAITQVADRFVQHLTHSSEPNSKRSKFSQTKIGGRFMKSLSISDLIMVGNENKLNVKGSDRMQQIYLPSRMDVLKRVVNPKLGWRFCCKAMLELLIWAETKFANIHNMWNDAQSLNALREKADVLIPKMSSHIECMLLHVPLSKKQKKSLAQISQHVQQLRAFLAPDQPIHISKWFDPANKFKTLLQPNYVHSFLRGVGLKYKAIERQCLGGAKLVFSTVGSLERRHITKKQAFDCVVIDEAAQLLEAEISSLIQFKNLHGLVLIGDHKQLPSTIISNLANQSQLGRSLFDRLHLLHFPSILLSTQYRMHPSISDLPNREFYDGKLQDGSNVLDPSHSSNIYQKTFFGTYCFINVDQLLEQNDLACRSSKSNLLEVTVVMHMIRNLFKVCERNGVPKLTIGIITPYSGQVEALKRNLELEYVPKQYEVEINSIDAFQGSEKDVVIFSTVRANVKGNIGFLSDRRRVNVAITRARHCLWIMGNAATITAKDALWKKLINDARARGCAIQLKTTDGMIEAIEKAFTIAE